MLQEENKAKYLIRGVLSILKISRETHISFSFIAGKKKIVNQEKFYCPGFYSVITFLKSILLSHVVQSFNVKIVGGGKLFEH